MSPQRILFIDAYDSFSNNIISLLKSQLSVQVESIHIDDPRFVFNDDAFHAYLQHFGAVVAGPGPGHPGTSDDIGLIAKLWNLPDHVLLPVLGICLGFQSLCLAHEASVGRLKEPRHGLVTPVVHCGEGVFAGTGNVLATQYHSLHVKLDGEGGRDCSIGGLWFPSRDCKELVPLAWDLSDEENGAILMSARHCHKPFWGVQYHPESICTNVEGRKLVVNWWREVCRWNAGRFSSKNALPVLPPDTKPKIVEDGMLPAAVTPNIVKWKTVRLGTSVDAAQIARALASDSSFPPLLLESGTRDGRTVNPETGRYSIIGLHDGKSTHFRYSTSTHMLSRSSSLVKVVHEKKTVEEVFEALDEFVAGKKACDGPVDVPFWGGLIGFISYEAGLETIDVSASASPQARPDIWFVHIERSVVVDHLEGTVFVQTLVSEDTAWLEKTMAAVLRSSNVVSGSERDDRGGLGAKVISEPDQDAYCRKVLACQTRLRAGSSYELCLTDRTHIRSSEDPWSVYLRLRAQNPAPFGAFLSLVDPLDPAQSVEVLSSSPERFLSWDSNGICQFRPIKGTVKKAPGVSRAVAEELLRAPKEQAENLMIVDLIRHDLSGAPGIQNVHVPSLMAVEEYATVFQLVSVISGQLSPGAFGVPILTASLPPGSMTGAPKKRSCQLLQNVEDQQPRGLYSGVLGYLDVGGRGDFSVVIRTAFRYGGEDEAWRVGAGGAITVLSEAEAEWEEMVAKRDALMRVFGVS